MHKILSLFLLCRDKILRVSYIRCTWNFIIANLDYISFKRPAHAHVCTAFIFVLFCLFVVVFCLYNVSDSGTWKECGGNCFDVAHNRLQIT